MARPDQECLPMIWGKRGEISLGRIQGIWMRAESLTSFATVTGDKVKSASAAMPYGSLTVSWTDRDEAGAAMRALFAVCHREDFRALHWLFAEGGAAHAAEIRVKYSPRRVFGGVFPHLAISVNIAGPQGWETAWSKGANAPFARPA